MFVPRGELVKIPRPYYDVLMQSISEEERMMNYIDKLKGLNDTEM
jgi:hypothetical protein